MKEKLLTSAKIAYNLEFFFRQTNDNKLVSMCPKFEVKSFCGWDFNQGGNQRYPRHPMHNRVKYTFIDVNVALNMTSYIPDE